jgi:hypothetical protein
MGWEVFGGWASVFRYVSFKSRCCDAPAHTIKLCFWLVYPIFNSIGVQQSALANHRDLSTHIRASFRRAPSCTKCIAPKNALNVAALDPPRENLVHSWTLQLQ